MENKMENKISKSLCLIFVLLLMSCIGQQKNSNNQNAKKPNIVLIFADDMGRGDISGINPEGKIHTPHLDSMIKNGLDFSDAHTSSSVCTPSRYSLLTGRYNWRSSHKRGVVGPYSKPVIEKGRTTLASLLKKNGYNTGMIGKWHLGWNWQMKKGKNPNKKLAKYPNVDYNKPISGGPLDNGFDYFFGIHASPARAPFVYTRQNNTVTAPTVIKKFGRTGPSAADYEAIDVLPILTKDAVGYINSKADESRNGKPFFLYFALTAPHTPILPSKEWQDSSKIKSVYADFTQQVDHTVGEVLTALRENGLEDNTIVLFIADNGTSPQADYKELLSKGHNPSYKYRGHKADLYEGGHRVPFIIQWKNKITKSAKVDNLIVMTDLLSTVANIVGDTLQDNEGEDSISFNSLLSDQPKNSIRKTAIHHSIKGSFAIRYNDWKLQFAAGSGGWTPHGARYKDIHSKKHIPPGALNNPNEKIEDKNELYNLKKDIGEYNNVIDKHPDIVKMLKEKLIQDVERGRSTPGKRQRNTTPVTINRINHK